MYLQPVPKRKVNSKWYEIELDEYTEFKQMATAGDALVN